ncbi:hypothetical protein [Methanobacterium sp. BAmetb5]|uniref:capsular polysaccharide export protein, LipB/KpsS family n=1 Tax=Methanobacterium sp. BAmetb5 TaxID=2025351 RepID=UPI000E89845B|nr:hypothetical protein [Methanobacterium sp. BAmetb5]AXV38914.1 MAG: hypothetical protein CIT02_00605 [Methanobacterium sp. BAmetb5]
MVNIALIIGTSSYGKDILSKAPWVSKLDSNHHVFVASRVKPKSHLNDDLKILIGDEEFDKINSAFDNLSRNAKMTFLYDSQFLHEYSEKEKEDMEKWLGISFRYISSFSRLFYDRSKYKDSRNQNKLNDYIVGLISFYKNFFIENDVDLMINTLEDTTFSVVSFFTARRLGIKVVSIFPSRFPKPGFSFNENFNEVLFWNDKTTNIDTVRQLYSSKTITGEKVLSENVKYWKFKSIPRRLDSIRYLYRYNKFKKNLLKKYPEEFYCFYNQNIMDIIYKYLIGLIRISLIKLVIKDPNLNDNFFFFPLHYTADAQITFKEPMLDQIDLCKKISRALPNNCNLYIKPHPHYFGSDTNFKEIYGLSKFTNIKIIHPSVPPQNLIKNAVGVITINSTSGFEALIMETPVISFGHDFYCKEDLCFIVRDLNELSEILLKILNGEGKSKEYITKFICSTHVNTIFISNYEEPSDEDWTKIANGFDKMLSSI